MMKNYKEELFLDDAFWNKFGEIEPDNASDNKVLPYNGVGFVFGKPASRKTTIVLDTVKSMSFDRKYYVDCDSKSIAQAKTTFTELSKFDNFKYMNTLLADVEPVEYLNRILETIKLAKEDVKYEFDEELQEEVEIKGDLVDASFCIVVDTWHQVIEDENDNHLVKALMKKCRSYAQRYNILIVFIAHVGKSKDNDIRGASAVSGDATFKVLVESSDIDNEFKITPTKDSLGILESSTAIFTQSSSISNSEIKYSTEIKEEKKVKPKDAALQATMVNIVRDKIKENGNIRLLFGEFKEFLIDNANKINKFKPSDPLFLSEYFIKNNFSDFATSLFEVENAGRRKYIVGILNQ